jgi:hypothetical protein
LDQSVISNLDSIIVTTMKCLHRLSQQLKQSPYGDAGRMAALQGYKQQAMGLIQFASGMRLRLGPDVYRQLSSMSEWARSWDSLSAAAGMSRRWTRGVLGLRVTGEIRLNFGADPSRRVLLSGRADMNTNDDAAQSLLIVQPFQGAAVMVWGCGIVELQTRASCAAGGNL